jgi:hypothetical protein
MRSPDTINVLQRISNHDPKELFLSHTFLIYLPLFNIMLRHLDGSHSMEVWITDVESQKVLQVHKVGTKITTHGKEVSGYITSIAGQRFKVCLRANSAYTSLSAQIYIDGQWTGGVLIDGSGDLSSRHREMECVDGGPGQIYPYRFGMTETSGWTFEMRLICRKWNYR